MEFIIGFIILIADIWALLNVLQSSAGGGTKTVWVIVILLLPLVGMLIWLVAGPRRAAV